MYRPEKTLSSERLINTYGVYLEAKLGAHPETAGHFATFEMAQLALMAANHREQRAQRAVHLALAKRDDAAFLMDRLLFKFQLAVRSDANGDRTNAGYLRLFPVPVSDHENLSPVRKLEIVRKLESVMIGSTDVPSVEAWMPVVSAHRAALEEALAAWVKATQAHVEAYAAELVERDRWSDTYDVIHGELIKLYPGDRKQVESFFRRGPKPKRAEEESSPPTAAGT